MGLVVSLLEEEDGKGIYGTNAMSLSYCSNENGGLYTGLYVGLICVGNVVKWVACVVSYHAYRTRFQRRRVRRIKS
ncbi:BnaC05g18970D [Brassica napus]|uniref:(rape) hypothetical protein n=1 Tax=Brassica napus TaxID=3708 RepID=A0A078ICQ4_BRANA|nr:unnamed protein product [Brassica napus]CDY47641.1 BnaC05g18970D [Brassica napus]